MDFPDASASWERGTIPPQGPPTQVVQGLERGATSLLLSSQKGGSSILGAAAALLGQEAITPR